jgi:hypothetical protein
MKKIVTLLILLSFTALMACMSFMPLVYASDTGHSKCSEPVSSTPSDTACSGHNTIDAISQSSGILTVLDIFFKAAPFVMVLSVIVALAVNERHDPYRKKLFAFRSPSTSFLLHRKTVLIRP